MTLNQSNGFHEHTLSNGLRVVIEVMPHVHSAASGFLVRTGARDETPELAGVSHFLEHMCFKGTAQRTWRDITIAFDNIGSTYNAYTSKEKTVFYGWVRVDDLEAQTDLLADMMRSVIPPEEFEMEKKVVLEEIAMSEDQIDHRLYDLAHERAFAGHPLAWPILGTQKTIEALTRDQLHGYFADRYQPANMVLIVAGAVDPSAVIAMAEKICGGWSRGTPRPARQVPAPLPSLTTVSPSDRFQQQALLLAYPAPSAIHADRETADVFAAVLGGHNSRFYWNIIQAGIAPQVAAGRMDYCDNGMMTIWGFCEPAKAEQLLEAIEREVRAIHEQGVTEDEVQRVKNRARTGLATEAESPYYRFMQLVQDVDVLGRPRDIAERLAAIEAVSAQSVRRYLDNWPLVGRGCLTSLGPLDWPKT